MKKKVLTRILLALVCTTLTIALGACSGDKDGGDDSSQITIGIPQDIEDSLDPHKTVAAGTEEVLFNLYEGLVKPDSSGQLQPAVASSYTISEDATTYTFTLREGVLFHDGSEVTAEDVKYSLERCAGMLDEELLVSAFSAIESVNILDESTIEVVLSAPDTSFLAYFDVAIIPASNEDPANNPIGTGPYRFISHSPQESFVIERFEDYWGTPGNIDQVTFKICASSDSIVMELQGGSIDMMARLTADQVAQLDTEQFEILEGTMNLVQGLFLNNAVEPFDNELVRQALCYTVDPQGIMDLISDGKGTETASAMFPAFDKYYMEELNDYYTPDYDTAMELLSEAGYPDGFTFTIKVPSNYQQHIDTAQVIVEQLKNINVTAEIELVEWETWLSDVYADRDYEATVVGLDASTLTAEAMLSRYVSDASNNFVNFNSEAYDEAYAYATSLVDDESKTEAFKECETILTKEAASVFIQDLPEFVAISKEYSGFVFYPLYVMDVSTLYEVEAD